MALTDERKRTAISRLRRLIGQAEGIVRMIEEDRYCVDVLLQIQATQAALARVGGVVLESHLQHCVADALASGDPVAREEKVGELMDVLARYGHLQG
jgi:DNA-binding FrmR family transcriptional regulator